MSDNVFTMPAQGHWRLRMYDEYIAQIKKRMISERSQDRERDQALLDGWIQLRAEFQAQLDDQVFGEPVRVKVENAG
jgi:hypothetical protein